ncbi:hypothetical protein, partial [Mycobacterium tuberculosis]|uniref:hypothetical protein n=1 Tax=Mycobacterium tuberculosis TaxID=1773 RepID=UPI001AE69E31|nr:hypothetical protein [Mycobacterium tuberculosis]
DMTRRRTAVAEAAERGALPLPAPKPRRDLDPDTAWNLATGFVPRVGELPQSPAATADPLKPNDRRVRVVGPKFFVAQ